MKKLLLVATTLFLVLMNIRAWGECGEFSPINTSIGLFSSGVEKDTRGKQNELDSALRKFKSSKDFGEVTIGQLLDVLMVEIVLVDHLLAGKSGQIVSDALQARDSELSRSVPSVAFMYNNILDAATYDKNLNTLKNRKRLEKGKTRKLSLSYYNKKEFLYRMQDTLEYYYALLRNIQYDLSISSGAKRHFFATRVDAGRGTTVSGFRQIRI